MTHLKQFLRFFHFSLQDELEPHERCIRKILEQKGRVVEIVYRLENSGENIVEGFEAFEEDDAIDEVGFDVTTDDEELFGEGPESALLERVRSAWVHIQLGNMEKKNLNI